MAYLNFLKFQFSTFDRVHSGVMYHRDSLIGCGDIAIKNFSKWQP